MTFRLSTNFLLLPLYPIAWILGLSALYLHVVVIVKSIKSFSLAKLKRIPKPALFIGCYIVVYLLSMVLNVGKYDFERFLASLYNLSFWVIGFLLILSVYHDKNFDLTRLRRYCKAVLILIASVGLFVIAIGDEPVVIDSLLGFVVNADSFPQLMRDSIKLKIMSKDWFDGSSSVRNSFLSPYSTATAATSLVLFSFVSIGQRVLSIKFFFWVVAAFIAIASTYSRLVTLLFMIYLLILLVLNLESHRKMAFSATITVVLLLMLPFLIDFVITVNEMRQGSSNIRFLMYSHTINYALENNMIYGVAVKDRGFFFIPLGSHSTYLGALLKTGVLGASVLLIYAFYFWKRFIKYYFQKKARPVGKSLSPMLMLMTIFFAFEDIDAAQFLSVVYFLSVGVFVRGEN